MIRWILLILSEMHFPRKLSGFVCFVFSKFAFCLCSFVSLLFKNPPPVTDWLTGGTATQKAASALLPPSLSSYGGQAIYKPVFPMS
jgi:hypothetical protein